MTPGIISAAQKCVDECNRHRTAIEFLDKAADLWPEWREAVDALKSKHTQADDIGQGLLVLSEQYSGA